MYNSSFYMKMILNKRKVSIDVSIQERDFVELLRANCDIFL